MTPILDLRIIVLDAVCRAQRLPDSAERTIALDHLRWAARTLLPLVQAEEDDAMRAHLRDRDTLPAPSPVTAEEYKVACGTAWHPSYTEQERTAAYETIKRYENEQDKIERETMLRPPPPSIPWIPATEPEESDVASHWSMSHE